MGLESNPEVLTEYAHKLGVQKSWGFSDVYGLDEDALKAVPSPCVGLIFLYPYSQVHRVLAVASLARAYELDCCITALRVYAPQVESRKKALGKSRGKKTPGVWFMAQTIGNACGAVALMHTVMNCLSTVSKDSSFLAKFDADTKGAGAAERGKLFGGALRDLHDEVAPSGQTDAPNASADCNVTPCSSPSLNPYPASRLTPPLTRASPLPRLVSPPPAQPTPP